MSAKKEKAAMKATGTPQDAAKTTTTPQSKPSTDVVLKRPAAAAAGSEDWSNMNICEYKKQKQQPTISITSQFSEETDLTPAADPENDTRTNSRAQKYVFGRSQHLVDTADWEEYQRLELSKEAGKVKKMRRIANKLIPRV